MIALLSPPQWTQQEFGVAQLGDPRLNRRLMNVATRLAANPGGTLPQAFKEGDELKGAYRFFDNKRSTFEGIIQPHVERTRQACQGPGEYLMIEDTTELDYSHHPAAQNLGVMGDGQGRGFELHSALAVRVEGWNAQERPEGTLMGLFGQRCQAPQPAPEGESRRERLSRPRKSQRWAAAIKEGGCAPSGCRWIYIADQESDFWEPMELCAQQGWDFIIRAYQDRRLAEEGGPLWTVVAAAPVLGHLTVEVRARPGQPARTAIVAVRSVPVDLDGPWRPGGWRAPLRDLWAVEVKEIDAPPGVKEPLHWLLLTSLPCPTLAQARRVVGRYSARWWVEEYHKALKSGTQVQESQMEEGHRLAPLIGVLAVVATRLLSAKLLARAQPEGEQAAQSLGPGLLLLLESQLGKPQGGWTNANVVRSMARLGGFLGRKSDGQPGWQTIWRGWHRLMWMSEGVETFMHAKKRCG